MCCVVRAQRCESRDGVRGRLWMRIGVFEADSESDRTSKISIDRVTFNLRAGVARKRKIKKYFLFADKIRSNFCTTATWKTEKHKLHMLYDMAN